MDARRFLSRVGQIRRSGEEVQGQNSGGGMGANPQQLMTSFKKNA